MDILYFYSAEYPQAIAALPESAERIYTGEDDFQYWRELKARWDTGSDLLIIEQDNISNPEAIEDIESCEYSPWCCYAYWHIVGGTRLIYHGLGFTKFSAEFQAAIPFPAMIPWAYLDMLLRMQIQRYQFEWPHCHGVIEHAHDWDKPVIIAGREMDVYNLEAK